MRFCIWNVDSGKRFSDFMSWDECIQMLKSGKVPSSMTSCIVPEDIASEWESDDQ